MKLTLCHAVKVTYCGQYLPLVCRNYRSPWSPEWLPKWYVCRYHHVQCYALFYTENKARVWRITIIMVVTLKSRYSFITTCLISFCTGQNLTCRCRFRVVYSHLVVKKETLHLNMISSVRLKAIVNIISQCQVVRQQFECNRWGTKTVVFVLCNNDFQYKTLSIRHLNA